MTAVTPLALTLALTLITLAALCAIIMMLRNRGGWVSVTVVLGLVLIGALILLGPPRSQARRFRMPRAPAMVLDNNWGQTEVIVGTGSHVTSVELPETLQIGEEQRGKLQLGVRLEDGKLVVGGFAALKEPPATQPGAPAPPEPPGLSEIDREKLEQSLRETVERAVARKLDEFFDKLTEAREVEPELTPLRAALKPLGAAQRRGLALRLARHSDKLTRDTALCGVQNVDLPGLLGVELALCPEGVGTLAETALAAQSSSTWTWPLPAHLSFLVTVSALIVATFVLKVATRRHTAPHGR